MKDLITTFLLILLFCVVACLPDNYTIPIPENITKTELDLDADKFDTHISTGTFPRK